MVDLVAAEPLNQLPYLRMFLRWLWSLGVATNRVSPWCYCLPWGFKCWQVLTYRRLSGSYVARNGRNGLVHHRLLRFPSFTSTFVTWHLSWLVKLSGCCERLYGDFGVAFSFHLVVYIQLYVLSSGSHCGYPIVLIYRVLGLFRVLLDYDELTIVWWFFFIYLFATKKKAMEPNNNI